MSELPKVNPEELELDRNRARVMAYSENRFQQMLINAKKANWPEETINLLMRQAQEAGEKAGEDYDKKTAEEIERMKHMLTVFGYFLHDSTITVFRIYSDDTGQKLLHEDLPFQPSFYERENFAQIIGAEELSPVEDQPQNYIAETAIGLRRIIVCRTLQKPTSDDNIIDEYYIKTD